MIYRSLQDFIVDRHHELVENRLQSLRPESPELDESESEEDRNIKDSSLDYYLDLAEDLAASFSDQVDSLIENSKSKSLPTHENNSSKSILNKAAESLKEEDIQSLLNLGGSKIQFEFQSEIRKIQTGIRRITCTPPWCPGDGKRQQNRLLRIHERIGRLKEKIPDPTTIGAHCLHLTVKKYAFGETIKFIQSKLNESSKENDSLSQDSQAPMTIFDDPLLNNLEEALDYYETTINKTSEESTSKLIFAAREQSSAAMDSLKQALSNVVEPVVDDLIDQVGQELNFGKRTTESVISKLIH